MTPCINQPHLPAAQWYITIDGLGGMFWARDGWRGPEREMADVFESREAAEAEALAAGFSLDPCGKNPATIISGEGLDED